MSVLKCPCDCLLQDSGVEFLIVQYLVQIVIIFHSAALVRKVDDGMHLFGNDRFERVCKNVGGRESEIFCISISPESNESEQSDNIGLRFWRY